MTPTFCWVFLLGLVGRATSIPRLLVVDACALLCNPGAEIESERERDPILFPRYPKVNCKLQSESDEHQAWVIASHCMKLCNNEISISSEVNCFALRSFLQANLGCYCEVLTPLSPNTMRLHESWRLNFLVKEISQDILDVILTSALDIRILCEIHKELFKDVALRGGKLVESCESKQKNITTPAPEEASQEEASREKREIDNESSTDQPPAWEEEEDLDMYMEEEEFSVKSEKDDDTEKEANISTDSNILKLFSPEQEKELYQEWKRVCKKICEYESGKDYCNCQKLLSLNDYDLMIII